MRCSTLPYLQKNLNCNEKYSHKSKLDNAIVTCIDLGSNTLRDRPLVFYRGVTISGTCRQLFFKSNAFQTIFFITFCNEKNFLRSFLKNITGFFVKSYLKKALPVHAYT